MNTSNAESNITKEERDFATEIVVDSTAPLQKILRDLLDRETFSKAYKFYRYLVVQRRHTQYNCLNYHYALPGHPLKAFEKGWDGDISSDYFEHFPYRSTMPKVISPMRNIQKSDPVTDFLKIKSDWKHEMLTMKRCGTNVAQVKQIRRFNEDVMQVPKYLIDIAAKMEQDPDPNFNSTYNWYYAGNGNLQLVCISWVDYLLHSEFSVVYLTRIHKDDMTIESEPLASFDCETDNILETICSSQNVVALRTKHKIIFLKIIEKDSTIAFEKVKQFESQMPFTSISFDNYHTNILYTTTLDGNLKIVNIDRVKARSVETKRRCSSNVDNWNCVIGAERATYAHVEPRAITFYDKRTNGAVNSWTGLRQIVDETLCNDITAAKRCEGSPALYFATDHHVLLMDLRCTRRTQLRPLMRWTHGLRCAPTYMSIARADTNRELVVVASQWCEDTCVVSNYADFVERAGAVRGASLPYHPPDVLRALHEARLRMLCFDLASPIQERLVTAVTGQALFEQGENCALLTHNSLGDVSLRTLHPEYMASLVDDDSAARLHAWAAAYRRAWPAFEVSRVANIANVWGKLRRVPDDHEFVPSEREVFDESTVYAAFESGELLPELLDAWAADGEREPEDDSFALNLHFADSDEE